MAHLAAELCIAPRDVSEPRLAQGGVLLGYAVSEGTTTRVDVHHLETGRLYMLATTPAVRPGRGLGGGAWCFTPGGSAIVYAAVDGNLWHQPIDGANARRLTDHGPDRVASSPCVDAESKVVVYVLDQAEVWCAPLARSAAIYATTGRYSDIRRIDAGTADFCLDPWIMPDGSVEWLAWDVPDMPWDRSRVERARLDGTALEPRVPAHAVQQPRSVRDGRELSVRDDHGWLNLWLDGEPLVEEASEHGTPTWGPGQRSFAPSPDGLQVAFTRNEQGFGRLCVVDIASGRVREVARGVHGQLSWEGDHVAALRTGARTPTQVVLYSTAEGKDWPRSTIAMGPGSDWRPRDLAELVEPVLVEVPAKAADGAGEVVHARLYAADHPDGRLIIWLHGGPTDQWQVTFMPRLAYWRSRGLSVLVPDHRGSTGHGRAYQQALRERWGELDVDDIVTVAAYAHHQRWGAPDKTLLMGSSAGGFTALGAIGAAPERFAAAVLLYPVTDLLDLAERSHRFERHYTDSLIGPLPDASDRYRERSPVWHASRFTKRPLLVLHGDVDPVVPVEHSLVFAERVRAAGGTVQVHVYRGEGHGFRGRNHQLDEYHRIGVFLRRRAGIGSAP
ncbi:MAG TPA: prolyl oligopeptidase family serine peptidase [Ilumatobacteraceae bacterium]|nr:prolyl oligopeptidase family serine peptidase [Ilumatobacteraceae bacterium]